MCTYLYNHTHTCVCVCVCVYTYTYIHIILGSRKVEAQQQLSNDRRFRQNTTEVFPWNTHHRPSTRKYYRLMPAVLKNNTLQPRT